MKFNIPYGAVSGFLPSSFSMYAVTLSSALFLLKKPAMAVSVAAIGVLLGWPFSILAVLPLTVYSLMTGRFLTVFLSGVATSLVTMVSPGINAFIKMRLDGAGHS